MTGPPRMDRGNRSRARSRGMGLKVLLLPFGDGKALPGQFLKGREEEKNSPKGVMNCGQFAGRGEREDSHGWHPPAVVSGAGLEDGPRERAWPPGTSLCSFAADPAWLWPPGAARSLPAWPRGPVWMLWPMALPGLAFSSHPFRLPAQPRGRQPQRASPVLLAVSLTSCFGAFVLGAVFLPGCTSIWAGMQGGFPAPSQLESGTLRHQDMVLGKSPPFSVSQLPTLSAMVATTLARVLRDFRRDTQPGLLPPHPPPPSLTSKGPKVRHGVP